MPSRSCPHWYIVVYLEEGSVLSLSVFTSRPSQFRLPRCYLPLPESAGWGRRAWLGSGYSGPPPERTHGMRSSVCLVRDRSLMYHLFT